ncbi:MAG: CBS domain-containing protein, partial [Archaeoglobaceae archaeon]
MTKNVVMVDYATRVKDVCRIMGEKKIGSVVVTKEGKPFGIFTERDLL